MSVSLDITKAHAAHQIGDIIKVLTWVNDERAMVLMPAHRRQGAPWYIVCESAAYKYDNPEYLAKQSRRAAEVLGMDETTSTWYRIAKMIHDGLQDLIRMPSAPEKELLTASHGEMKAFEDGKLLRAEDIRFEKDGATYG